MSIKPNQDMRLVHHITVGVDRSKADARQIDEVFEDIKSGITRKSGGVIAFICDGTWTAGSEAGIYTGPIEDDAALNFIVTLTYEEEGGGAWEGIKTLIAKIVRKHELGCHHIHVAMWLAQAKHFHVMDVEASNDNAGSGHRGAA